MALPVSVVPVATTNSRSSTITFVLFVFVEFVAESVVVLVTAVAGSNGGLIDMGGV